MATDDMEITNALREPLLKRVGQQRLNLWFGSNTRLAVRDRTLVVEVATPLFQQWLQANFRDVLGQCCEDAFGERMAVEFRVNPQLAGPQAEGDHQDARNASESVWGNSEDASAPDRPGPERSAPPQSKPANINPPRTIQRRLSRFDSFAVGHANRVAYASAQMAAERLGSVSPLFLHGATGVGKTHLLESIFSHVTESQPGTGALYLAAEQFTSLFLEALHHSGLPSFRRKYRNVELLILDDVQFFTGKNATLGELLHTIDTLLRKGRQVILAADRPPSELNGVGPELTSRLVGGMVCRVEPPDHAVRREIIRRYADRLGVALPDEVQQLVASRLTDNARELFGAVNRLHATSQAHQQPITVAMAEEALADLTVRSGRMIQLADIEKAVCDIFDLRPDSLRSARKLKAISHPRMLAMWLARKYTRNALSEIGEFFGRRSHTTVISAQKRVNGWMEHGDQLSIGAQQWHVEEAIRRVELKLKAG